jgi:hypothetical protein
MEDVLNFNFLIAICAHVFTHCVCVLVDSKSRMASAAGTVTPSTNPTVR